MNEIPKKLTDEEFFNAIQKVVNAKYSAVFPIEQIKLSFLITKPGTPIIIERIERFYRKKHDGIE